MSKHAIINAFNCALETPDAVEKPLPDSIQWMPPGRHDITAHKNGKPARVSVTVNAKTAETVKNAFLALQAKGKRPFLDFNHKGDAASANVSDVFWGGDDPKSGGVRARIAWTKPGEDALRGRAYSSFSPTFLLDDKGLVTGATANMGGLVNDPAFTAIAPVMGKNGETTKDKNTMEKLMLALAAAGLVTAGQSDEEATASFNAAFAPIKAKAASADDLNTKLEAANAEILKTKEEKAESLINAACADGRLSAKDEASRKFWKGSLIQAGSAAEEALKALTPNPAFRQVVKVEARAAASQGQDSTSKQESLIQAKRASSPGMTYASAWEACAIENPEVFKA